MKTLAINIAVLCMIKISVLHARPEGFRERPSNTRLRDIELYDAFEDEGTVGEFREVEVENFREQPGDTGPVRRRNHNRERGPAGRMHTDMPMPTPANGDMDMGQIMNYFEKYNYMGENMPDKEIADLVKRNMSMAIHEATRIFQTRYVRYGLSVTGELDRNTIELMMKPRCGVADIMSMNDMRRRSKRYLISPAKWNKQQITYQITKYPVDDLSPQEVDREIRRAFSVWEEVTPLRFTRLEYSDRSEISDIEIRFEAPYNDHGDGRGNAFDGRGGTLAHAFFPFDARIGGDTHFDDAEIWTLTSRQDGRGDYNLFQVAAHEFGHALGLGHSTDPSALMAPFYPGYIPNFVLPLDDVMGIQAIYGGPSRPMTTTSTPSTTTTELRPTRPNGRPTTTRRPTPSTTASPGTNICKEASFDAVTTILVGRVHKTYGFKGQHYFLIDERTGGIAHGYPRLISQGWPGLPDNIDAALFWDQGEWKWDSKAWKWIRDPAMTYIFKGDLYWEVGDMSVVAGPKLIQNWGLPRDIDAAFVWRRNGQTYVFKGDEYYRYTRGVGLDEGYPRRISVWGLPNNIDAAFQYANGQTFFFKDEKFYAYDDANVRVESGYPRDSHGYWFRC